jgi:hypothetical protein
MENSIDTNDIKLDISEEIGKYNHNYIPPILVPKFHPSKSLKEYLNESLTEIEKEFQSELKMTTTSVEYKANYFNVKVKLILEPNKLIAYKSIQGQPDDLFYPLVVLDFDMITAAISVSKKKTNKFTIYVLGAERNFSFIADNQQILNAILVRLNFFIENSLGAKTNLLGISLRKDFNKVTTNKIIK